MYHMLYVKIQNKTDRSLGNAVADNIQVDYFQDNNGGFATSYKLLISCEVKLLNVINNYLLLLFNNC